MNSLALQTTSYHRRYRSRTELETDRMDLGEQLERNRLQLWVTGERLHREMETSIRLGTEAVALRDEVRRLEHLLHFAQRKLGWRV
ncbi:hypothetical protein LCGC14_1413030 [marine sediment metagenome]|uniref:Uncharacterized protein n=1 Tax=marine sediment metagenome TaxID=412755 RepID=A0A0F9JU09_9ZZZZ